MSASIRRTNRPCASTTTKQRRALHTRAARRLAGVTTTNGRQDERTATEPGDHVVDVRAPAGYSAIPGTPSGAAGTDPRVSDAPLGSPGERALLHRVPRL